MFRTLNNVNYPGGCWGMMGPWMMGYGGGWIGGLVGLFTWILIIAILVALLRWLWKKGSQEK